MQIMSTRRTWLIVVGVLAGVLIALIVAVAVSRMGPNDQARTDDPHPMTTDVAAGSGPVASPSVTAAADDAGASGTLLDRSGEAVLVDRRIQSGIIQREYLVMEPSWATDGTDGTDDMAMPLVVVLHGLTVDRWEMAQTADWKGAVQRNGFVAVFPQGLANSWNSGSCCPPSSVVGTDDVGFLYSVIAAVVASEPVDPQRVFMTGFSNGGIMTYRYGCARASTLAAIAPVAGSNLERCAPDVPLSLLHQHSDPDPVVPFDGGFGVGRLVASADLPPVPDSVARWASDIGCADPVSGDRTTDRVTVTRWEGCPTGTKVELVRIAGIGHEWPRTDDHDGLAEILDFFGLS